MPGNAHITLGDEPSKAHGRSMNERMCHTAQELRFRKITGKIPLNEQAS